MKQNQRLLNWGARRAACKPYFFLPEYKTPVFSMYFGVIISNEPQFEPQRVVEPPSPENARFIFEIKSLG